MKAEEYLKQYQKGSDYFAITKGEAINKLNEFSKLKSIEFAKWLRKNAQPRFPNNNEWTLISSPNVIISLEELYKMFENEF